MTAKFGLRRIMQTLLFTLPVIATALPVGAQEKKTVGQPDNISYIDNGTIRLGVNLNLGGAITYLGPAKSEVNLINSYDWGRQIQMSHYSGPVPFAPNGKKPASTWAGLGWNPIQAGDYFGNRSKILTQRNDGKSLYVKCVPMQWPLDNEPGECTFECWIELKGATALVRARLHNARSDKTQYSGRGQELPAVYTNGPWHRLVTYTGAKPFANDTLTTISAATQFPWAYWKGTENWAALVNDDNWGLGIYEPGAFSFGGGFFGKPGTGGMKDAATGYIAPGQEEILDYNIDYEYNYVLIVGKLDEIRRQIYGLAPTSAPPNYRFVADRQHWRYVNAADTGWPIQGELKVLMSAPDPQLVGPPGLWQATATPKLYIEAACHLTHPQAQLFWQRHDSPNFAEAQSVHFELNPDGQYHVYEVNLAAAPEYRGAITGLRFDPEPSGAAGDFIRVKSISFIKPAG